MSSNYGELLDATIQHLEGMKARGVRHVAVAPETVRALAQPAKSFQFPVSSFQSPVPAPAPVARDNPPVVIPAPKPPEPKTENRKLETFNALRERALACVKCPNLASSRKNVVFGVGNIDILA